MEIIKFNPSVGGATVFERGSVVNDIKSVMWIERYLEPCEFELTALVSSNIQNTLPIGSFVSHMDSLEVMVVENHEIQENSDGESEITISGRSFEVLLDNRITGSNQTWSSTGQPVSVYTLAEGRVWTQAQNLIAQHILAANLVDPNDELPNTSVMIDEGSVYLYPGDPASEERTLKRSSVYQNTLELLEMANLGIRTIRPGPWSPLTTNQDTNVALVIHRGLNKTRNVTFSHSSNEVSSAQYFWSSRKKKTSAFIFGKWLSMVIHGSENKYNRKMMIIDASDLDEEYSELPTGTDRTNIITAMTSRAQRALAAQNDVAISKVEINKNFTRYNYRQDYYIGDLVSVEGNYNTSSVARVIEYVEIQDETGENSYPTLEEI